MNYGWLYPRKQIIGSISSEEAIWHYMDFQKFVDIVTGSHLYFCRADMFDDQFEGRPSLPSAELMQRFLPKLIPENELKSSIEQIWEDHSKFHVISCWHRNDDQSDAMWKLYANRGIAIKSTFERLSESLEPDLDIIYFGNVNYLDYQTQYTPFEGVCPSIGLFLCKRSCFKHEQELRAIIMRTERNSQLPVASGVRIRCDVNKLISEIYVSPLTQEWHVEVVLGLLRKCGLDKTVTHSKLYDRF